MEFSILKWNKIGMEFIWIWFEFDVCSEKMDFGLLWILNELDIWNEWNWYELEHVWIESNKRSMNKPWKNEMINDERYWND